MSRARRSSCCSPVSIWLGWLASTLLFALSSHAQTNIIQPGSNAYQQAFAQEYLLEFFGDVSLAGTVEDDAGAPLSNVEVRVSINDVSNVVYHVDHAFALEFTNCAALRMEFRKDGYDSQWKMMSVGKDGRRTWGGRKVLTDHALKIVLDKQGVLTQLILRKFFVERRPTGQGNVGDFAADPQYTDRWIQNLDGDHVLPDHGMYLAFRMDGTGHVAVVRMSCETDGFVLGPTDESDDRNMRRMKTAPDVGYVTEMPVPKQCWSFYYRIGGQYGKGFAFKNGGDERDIRLVTFTQPDGSRNLEAKEYRW